jgi:hypothetical protein
MPDRWDRKARRGAGEKIQPVARLSDALLPDPDSCAVE